MHLRVGVLILCLLAGPPATFALADQGDAFLVSEVMIPMRDGVKLATDVYRPARDGRAVEEKLPVLLFRTPYNKAGVRKAGAFFTAHGYVVVAQDCRGRFASEGEFYPFVNEGPDGYDTIQWAAAQPWSNGQVGTLGASYLGWVQLTAAVHKPPNLVAMFVEVAGADFFSEVGYPGGTPTVGWPHWILRRAADNAQTHHDANSAGTLSRLGEDPTQWWALPPQQRLDVFGPLSTYRRALQDFYAHSERDDYWRQEGFSPAEHYRRMKDVPMLLLSGWYDYFAEGTLRNFSALSRLQTSPKRLVIGPWPHSVGDPQCGDAFFGLQAELDQRELALDWFNHWMKGKPLGRVSQRAVRVFRMGGGDGSRTASGLIHHGGVWIEGDTWPLPDRPCRKYYLHASGALRTCLPPSSEPSRYVFDPDNPVPTIGGRYRNSKLTPNGPQNQVCSPKIFRCTDSNSLSERRDVLTFQTEPLPSDVEVTGTVRAKLWISSDAVDTDFTAKLIDVFPDGYAMILVDGQVRTRYRNGSVDTELMTPGEIYEVPLELGSTSNLFRAGHRIRVDISSSNYPKVEPNPNTGEPAGQWTHRVKAHNALYHDPGHPSHVELPIADNPQIAR